MTKLFYVTVIPTALFLSTLGFASFAPAAAKAVCGGDACCKPNCCSKAPTAVVKAGCDGCPCCGAVCKACCGDICGMCCGG